MSELRVYKKAFTAMITTRLEYRVDFVVSMIGSFFFQLSPIATYAVIASQLPEIGGWSAPQVLFLFGLWAAALGLSELFCDNIWYLPEMVLRGELDRLLVYPVHTLPFFLITNPQLHAFGNLLTGSIMLGYSGHALHFEWWAWALLPFWAICGCAIYSAVLVLVSTLLIVMPGKGMDIAWLVQQSSQATRFPLHVFPRVIQVVLLFVIPLGCYNYLPGQWLFHGGSAWGGLLAPLATAVLLSYLAWRAWEGAMNYYESTGN